LKNIQEKIKIWVNGIYVFKVKKGGGVKEVEGKKKPELLWG